MIFLVFIPVVVFAVLLLALGLGTASKDADRATRRWPRRIQ